MNPLNSKWLNKLLTALLLAAAAALSVSAQPMTSIVQDYEWEEKPVLHPVDSLNSEELEVILKETMRIEYAYGEDDQLYEYKLQHVITKVLSDKAIEQNNKIYLPQRSVLEMVKQQARVITPKGEVINFNESNIKTSVDEETGAGYKYFALEGVEKGSEIEFLTLAKKVPNYTGVAYYMQSDTKKKKVSFDLSSPANLIFDFKSYNGWPEMEPDTNYREINVWRSSVDALEKLPEERMSAYEPNLAHVIYKLKDNRAFDKKDIVSYGVVSNSIFESIYGNVTKKNRKALGKIIKQADVKGIDDPKEKIRKLEDYVKQNYFFVEQANNNLDFVLEAQRGGKSGITSLFANLLKEMDIESEIVITANRSELQFDQSFEAYCFLQDYALYIPDIKMYMSPYSLTSRLGFINPYHTSNHGLFIRTVKLGDFEGGIGKIKFIEPRSYEVTKDILNLEASLNVEEQNMNIAFTREQTGYYANDLQLILELLKDEQKDDVKESLVRSLLEDAEIKEAQLLHATSSEFGKEPFTLKADITSTEVLETAGDKFIVKAGLLIGPQMELYQEDERRLPVVNGFNRWYDRKIVLNIPEGYVAKNMESLDLDVQDYEENPTAYFQSRHEVKDGKIIVTITEIYKKLNYDVEDYEAFRKVINAAADFNKATIILEKE